MQSIAYREGEAMRAAPGVVRPDNHHFIDDGMPNPPPERE
jgi:hypothetical protein